MRIGGIASVLLLLTACSGPTGDGQELVVSAAASLTDAFTEIEEVFELANPRIEVVYNFAGSSALREQILEGAPVDVFASANISNMDQVVAAGQTSGEPLTLVHNLLQIAVPGGNPAGITGLADFEDEDLLIGLCAEEVPCGDFARQALGNAGVTASIDTNEPDVRALLTKIEEGELDAGITYVTDVVSADGSVQGVDIPLEVNVVADYQIAVLAAATDQETARVFVEFVLSDEGQSIMTGFGFTSP